MSEPSAPPPTEPDTRKHTARPPPSEEEEEQWKKGKLPRPLDYGPPSGPGLFPRMTKEKKEKGGLKSRRRKTHKRKTHKRKTHKRR